MGRRYRLLVKLEEGSFAEHYKGSAEGAGPRDVLIKLFTSKASDPAYGKGLHDAATRTCALGVPGALGFDEIGLVQGRIAAVRPFVDGYNLGDALRRLSTKEVVLPPALALYLVAEAAQVVSAAHRDGWTHGAITPGNVLLGADGKVRVVEFGALEAMNASESLRPLATKGRNAYRAPEVKGAGASTPAADVYSLGAIAYELLTLKSVASSRSGGLSTKHDALTPPSRLDRRINARCDPVIMRALENAASRRYRSAADFADALRGLFSVLGYAPGAAEGARFVKELFPNEVSVSGGIGPVPFTEAFMLQPVEGVTSTIDLHAAFEERAPFTQADQPAFATEPPAAWREEKTPCAGFTPTLENATAPSAATQSAATLPPAKAASEIESWEAPPGVMPQAPALARHNRRPAKGSAPARPAEPEPEPAEAAAEDDSRSSTPQDSPAVPDAGFEVAPAPAQPKTSLDWHPAPQPPPEPPKPVRVNPLVWVLGVAVGLAVAAFIYLGVSQRLGRNTGPVDVVGERGEEAAPAPSPATPAPEAAPAPPEPKGPALLTVESDKPATLLIDGKESGKTTPVLRHAMAPGEHTITALVGTQMREKAVVLKPSEEEKVVFSFAAAPKKPAPRPKKGGSRK